MTIINTKLKNIDDFIVDYLEFCSYKNLSLKTIKSYHQTLMLFSQYLKEEKEIVYIRKVNKDIVKDYLEHLNNFEIIFLNYKNSILGSKREFILNLR